MSVRLLRFVPDDSLAREVADTRAELIDAALAHISSRNDDDAQRLRVIYTAERDAARRGERPRSTRTIDSLKRETLGVQRQRLIELRSSGAIDDDVFHTLEHQLDWVEIAISPPDRFEMDEG